MSEGAAVAPGDRLGSTDKFTAGPGTYTAGSSIHSSLNGIVHISSGKPDVVMVAREEGAQVVPKPGDIVTCRITRIAPQAASCEILCVGETPLPKPAPGIIKQLDVRVAGETVEMSKCFRPGDVVRAEVSSLGDARALYLTTARNDLGVVFAQSEAGFPMVPTSWTDMVCTKTRARELRKVAKVV